LLKASQGTHNDVPVLTDDIDTIINITAERRGRERVRSESCVGEGPSRAAVSID
jgi:hypothetical protein